MFSPFRVLYLFIRLSLCRRQRMPKIRTLFCLVDIKKLSSLSNLLIVCFDFCNFKPWACIPLQCMLLKGHAPVFQSSVYMLLKGHARVFHQVMPLLSKGRVGLPVTSLILSQCCSKSGLYSAPLYAPQNTYTASSMSS